MKFNQKATDAYVLEKNDSNSYIFDRHFFSHRVYLFIKRTFDIGAGVAGLIISLPIFGAVAIAIKKEDGGPVFFKHERVGQYGNKIQIYKFRSMQVDAPDLKNVLTSEQYEEYCREFKLENDPRITKVGHFIRRTSLDELPQLLNIIKGELSVVGPRPILPEEYGCYTEEEAEKLIRIKPGLTGYWQAYARNNATYANGDRQRMEMYYVEHASLWLDTKILFKTVESVLKKTGAK